MLLIGLVLVALAVLVHPLAFLFWIGVIVAICGAILLAGGFFRRGPVVGSRRYYY